MLNAGLQIERASPARRAPAARPDPVHATILVAKGASDMGYARTPRSVSGEIFHKISGGRNAFGGFGHPGGDLAGPGSVGRGEDGAQVRHQRFPVVVEKRRTALTFSRLTRAPQSGCSGNVERINVGTPARRAAAVVPALPAGQPMRTSCPRRTSSRPTAAEGSTSPRIPQHESTNSIAVPTLSVVVRSNVSGIGHYPWFFDCRLGVRPLASADQGRTSNCPFRLRNGRIGDSWGKAGRRPSRTDGERP
jgi:hypothetical protein